MLHMSEKSDRMPESIAAILGDAAGQADGLGKSGADVYLFDDWANPGQTCICLMIMC